MEFKEFKYNVDMLKNFFPVYCRDKHNEQVKDNYAIEYDFNVIEFEVTLCEECHNLLEYSLQRLQECPYEEKPRCRKCSDPCYERQKYKSVAKLMRYSGIRLGFIKVKSKFKNLIK